MKKESTFKRIKENLLKKDKHEDDTEQTSKSQVVEIIEEEIKVTEPVEPSPKPKIIMKTKE